MRTIFILSNYTQFDQRVTYRLPTGHLQTLYVVFGNFTGVDPVTYERSDQLPLFYKNRLVTFVLFRTLIRLPDGGTLGLDMTPPTRDAQDLPDDTPIVVVQHGLTGGSYESYVRSILSGACAPKSKGGLGFRGIVVNFRGCKTPFLFVSGDYSK